jgi:hypothetical protein
VRENYEHHCKECIFLCQDGEVDVYFCHDANHRPSIVLREHPDKMTGPSTPHGSWVPVYYVKKLNNWSWWAHYYEGVRFAARKGLVCKTVADETLVGK